MSRAWYGYTVRVSAHLCSDWLLAHALRKRPDRRKLHQLAAAEGRTFSGSPSIAVYETLQAWAAKRERKGLSGWVDYRFLASKVPRNPNCSKTKAAQKAAVRRAVRPLMELGGLQRQGNYFYAAPTLSLGDKFVPPRPPRRLQNSAIFTVGCRSRPVSERARKAKKSDIHLDHVRPTRRGRFGSERDSMGRFSKKDPTAPEAPSLRHQGPEPSPQTGRHSEAAPEQPAQTQAECADTGRPSPAVVLEKLKVRMACQKALEAPEARVHLLTAGPHGMAREYAERLSRAIDRHHGPPRTRASPWSQCPPPGSSR